MVIKFLKRTDEGIEEIATVTDQGKWSGDPKIKEWLTTEEFGMLDGPFDPTNKEHWKKILLMVSGARLWAVEG